MLVHFPIVFVLLTAALEIWRVMCDSASARSATRWFAVLAAVTAVVTAATGWAFGLEHRRSDTAELLDDHRWLGITTTILAILAAAAVWRWNETPNRGKAWVRRLLAWATAIVLIVAAHLGAMLVWGEDFFSS